MAHTTGAKLLADLMARQGVSHVFMVPAILRATLAELDRYPEIQRIHAHGEKAAAYMADGYSRVTFRPGVCMAQAVGAMNLAAGLRDAWLAHAPVIALTGGPTPETRYRGVYQEVEDLVAFDPVTKLNAAVDDVARVPDLVHQAFNVATSGAPGPVHLRFRGNEGQVDLDVADVAQQEIERSERARVPRTRAHPDPNVVTLAVDRLAAAERPVIVAGGGARSSGAGSALIALAERLQVPVATSLNGKDVIPGDHPLAVGVVGTYSRASANRIVSEADLVCFIGTATGGMTTHAWQLPRIDCDVIHVDVEPGRIGRNYPRTIGIAADARSAAVAIAAEVEFRDIPPLTTWARRAAEVVAEWREAVAADLSSDTTPINPARICGELSERLPDNSVVVVDTGHAGMWMGALYDVKRRQAYLRSAGHLGWAFPASLGAKCGAPDRPVVCFTGDAGLWYHIAEIETAVRWGINTVTVVNNNHSGNQSKPGFARVYGGQDHPRARELWTFTEVDFAALADQIGAVGMRVERPSEIGPAIERALRLDRPVVVDVVTDIDALAPRPWSAPATGAATVA